MASMEQAYFASLLPSVLTRTGPTTNVTRQKLLARRNVSSDQLYRLVNALGDQLLVTVAHKTAVFQLPSSDDVSIGKDIGITESASPERRHLTIPTSAPLISRKCDDVTVEPALTDGAKLRYLRATGEMAREKQENDKRMLGVGASSLIVDRAALISSVIANLTECEDMPAECVGRDEATNQETRGGADPEGVLRAMLGAYGYEQLVSRPSTRAKSACSAGQPRADPFASLEAARAALGGIPRTVLAPADARQPAGAASGGAKAKAQPKAAPPKAGNKGAVKGAKPSDTGAANGGGRSATDLAMQPGPRAWPAGGTGPMLLAPMNPLAQADVQSRAGQRLSQARGFDKRANPAAGAGSAR